MISTGYGLGRHRTSEAVSAEERGEPSRELSAATEHEPIPQVERAEPTAPVLETIWEGTDEDRSSTAPSLIVHDVSDEALKKGGGAALGHLLSDSESTRFGSERTNATGSESTWSPRSDISLEERRRPDFDLYPLATRDETTVPDHLYHVRCANMTADHLLADVNESERLALQA